MNPGKKSHRKKEREREFTSRRENNSSEVGKEEEKIMNGAGRDEERRVRGSWWSWESSIHVDGSKKSCVATLQHPFLFSHSSSPLPFSLLVTDSQCTKGPFCKRHLTQETYVSEDPAMHLLWIQEKCIFYSNLLFSFFCNISKVSTYTSKTVNLYYDNECRQYPQKFYFEWQQYFKKIVDMYLFEHLHELKIADILMCIVFINWNIF